MDAIRVAEEGAGGRRDARRRRARSPSLFATVSPRGTVAEVNMALLDEAREHLDDAVALRRAIHRHPEIGLSLPSTQRAVLEALDGLGLHVRTGEQATSVVATLDGGHPGPTVLLRGDMDALPMPEETGLEFASQIQ